ncbi:hypothetical protein HDU89_006926 [Geranomyces variabilis]|nr:hypothetical protein HDU89_006926 [Geranomyces variabilis]
MSFTERPREGGRRRRTGGAGHSRGVSVSLVVVSLAALVSASPVALPVGAPPPPPPQPAAAAAKTEAATMFAKRQAVVYFPSAPPPPAATTLQSIPLSLSTASPMLGVVVIDAPQSVLGAQAAVETAMTMPTISMSGTEMMYQSSQDSSPTLTLPTIIGLSCAIVIVIGVLVFVYWWFCRSRRRLMLNGDDYHPSATTATGGANATTAGATAAGTVSSSSSSRTRGGMTARDAIRVANALLPSSSKSNSNNNSKSKLFPSTAEITTPQLAAGMNTDARYPLRPESAQDLPVADFLLPDIVRLSALRGAGGGGGSAGDHSSVSSTSSSHRGGTAKQQSFDSWGHDYREEFGDHRVYPPPSVWESVMAASTSASVTSAKDSKIAMMNASSTSFSSAASSQNSKTNLLAQHHHEYDLAPPAAPLFRYPETTITPPPPPPPAAVAPLPASLNTSAPPRRFTITPRPKTPTTTTFSTTSSSSSGKRQQPRTPLTSQRSIHIYTTPPGPKLQHVVIDHRPLSARSVDSVSAPTTDLGSRFSAITEASLSRYLDD